MIEYKVNEIIEGTIISIRPFGAIMIFRDGKKGLLHISEIANTFIRNIKKYLKIGKTYQVKIIGIEEDGFLKLSMSKITDEEKEEYHNNGVKKIKIEPEFIDFSALKEKLPIWIKNAKEEEKWLK
mgnify:CR=1 FL=1